VMARALELSAATDFVNAYGLTETSSTMGSLGASEHREAEASSTPEVRARLQSVGTVLPGIDVEIRGEDGTSLPLGQRGELHVRGAQVSGEYVGRSAALDPDGWFATRDLARLDRDGYLYIEGRLDDTIIRGGENIAPAEIED